MVNALKLSIICMTILNLVFFIMISNQTFFSCMTGVRQDENVSLFLFSVFLNDLEDYFKNLVGCHY